MSIFPSPILGRPGKGQAGPINPKRLANLEWLFDMTDNSTVSQSGGLLTQLLDKSGQGNHSVPTGTQRGTVAIDATTGKQVLELNGSSNFLPLTSENTLTDFTLILVIKSTELEALKVIASSTTNSDYIATSGTSFADTGAVTLNNTTDGSISWTKDQSLLEYSIFIVRKKAGLTLRQQINARDSFRLVTSATFSQQKIGQLFRQNSGDYMLGGFAGGCLFSSYKSDVEVLGMVKHFYVNHGLSGVPRKNLFLGDSITNFSGDAFHLQVSVAEGRRSVMCGVNGTTVQANGTGISFLDRYLNFFSEYPYDNFHTILGGANDINSSLSASGFEAAMDAIVVGMIAQGTPAQNIRIGGGPYRMTDSLASTCLDFQARTITVATNRGTKKFSPYTKFKDGGADTWMNDTLHANQTGHDDGFTPEILAAS
jgi:hypothetical protein